jgi:hypothetical protein
MGPDGVAADARKLAERLTGQSSMPNLASSQTIAR